MKEKKNNSSSKVLFTSQILILKSFLFQYFKVEVSWSCLGILSVSQCTNVHLSINLLGSSSKLYFENIGISWMFPDSHNCSGGNDDDLFSSVPIVILLYQTWPDNLPSKYLNLKYLPPVLWTLQQIFISKLSNYFLVGSEYCHK